jgi:tRNA-2-methylthio-N6-dimethylallyladenosine synthase
MKSKRFYIETYGCQMNQADSEVISRILLDAGHQPAQMEEADIILLNTCAVREHAERRVLGRISQLHRLKLRKPELILAVVGCMAQRVGRKLVEKNPHLNLVAGPDSYRQLPQMIEASGNGRPFVKTELDPQETYSDIAPCRQERIRAWVPIMRGCNNFCSYCVVPYVRGRERSMSHLHILREILRLAEQGYKEVTLLGQNVNSYRDGQVDFAELLRLIDQNTGIPRLRFLSPHPKDVSERVLAVMAEGKSICEHLHLPLQSGSTKILQRMRRGYTAEQFLELACRARKAINGLALSTDIIVGFPGETEQDFQETLNLVQEIQFDSAFTYRYSPRRGTQAFDLPDDVPPEEKRQRLEKLISLQRQIMAKKQGKLIGSRLEVLVEKINRRGNLLGKTRTDRPVALEDGSALALGDIVEVEIVGATSATLVGKALSKGASTAETTRRVVSTKPLFQGGR